MTCFYLQKLLGVSQAEIRQKCQERVKELEELKTAVDSLKVRMMVVAVVNKAVLTAVSSRQRV